MARLGLHWFFWILPFLTFSTWVATLVTMLALWVRDGYSRYGRDANIVFISDVGAAHHVPFIGLCCTTAGLYILTVLLERQLRHARRIPGSLIRRTTNYDITSVVFAIIGALGLVFLSIFDTVDYPTVHWTMTLVFIVFVALSTIFQVLEVFSLAHRHPGRTPILWAAAVLKTIIVTLAIATAIAFAALYGTCGGDVPNERCNRITSGAGALEWTVAFLLALFFLTYILDFIPAKRNAEKGLTEDGKMVQDPERAADAGELKNHPQAPYSVARDMGPNHSQAEYNSQMQEVNNHNNTTVYGAGAAPVNTTSEQAAYPSYAQGGAGTTTPGGDAYYTPGGFGSQTTLQNPWPGHDASPKVKGSTNI